MTGKVVNSSLLSKVVASRQGRVSKTATSHMRKTLAPVLMKYFILSVLLITIACNNSSQREAQDQFTLNIDHSKEANQTERPVFKSNEELYQFERKAVEFYTWYLNKYYNGTDDIFEPTPVLNRNGTYEIDTLKYFDILMRSGYFSARYFEQERLNYELCNNELSKVNTKEVEECGCSPATFTTKCNFVFSDRWLFHQGESAHIPQVISSTFDDSIASVLVCVMDTIANSCTSEVIVNLSSDEDDWRIDQILTGS